MFSILKSSLLALASSSTRSASTSSTRKKRTFQFVEYGASLPQTSSRPTISCDGRVEGVTLELTHWNGNTTPEEFYADTSTEMALKLPQSVFPDAVIINNHYDSDGVLSVFACLEPERASQYADLMVAGAEAGDFGEWSSDSGVKLDLCLCNLSKEANGDEKLSFERALEALPALLEDLAATGGAAHEHLWSHGWNDACQSLSQLQYGTAVVRRGPRSGMVLLYEPTYLSPYAAHRHLQQTHLLKDCNRLLRITESSGSSSTFQYCYEKPGHGWVQKLIDRRPIPGVDSTALVARLNSANGKQSWSKGGPGGLIAICQSASLQTPPDEVAAILAEFDVGLQ